MSDHHLIGPLFRRGPDLDAAMYMYPKASNTLESFFFASVRGSARAMLIVLQSTEGVSYSYGGYVSCLVTADIGEAMLTTATSNQGFGMSISITMSVTYGTVQKM